MLSLASFAISLAALDTASPFGGLGASRASWVGSMAEPALIPIDNPGGSTAISMIEEGRADFGQGRPGPAHRGRGGVPQLVRAGRLQAGPQAGAFHRMPDRR